MPEATPRTLDSHARTTYRYLRLSIVLITVALLASMVIEMFRDGCAVGSISGYYYTPVRSIFVGGMVAIGVCLISIKEDTPWKDSLLNLSGALAPIVAFVPTAYPTRGCMVGMEPKFDTSPGIVNNVSAYAIAGLLAIILGVELAAKRQKLTKKFDRASWTVAVLAMAMLGGGLLWYFHWHRNFVDHAHIISAMGLFGVVGIVMVLNALDGSTKPDGSTNSKKLRIFYGCTAGAMVVGLLINLAINQWIIDDWQHQVLWLELIEMGAFLVYWVTQTFQHWDDGIKGTTSS